MTQGKRILALMCGLLVAAGLTGCYPRHETRGVATPFRSNMWQRHTYDYIVHNLRQRGVQVVRVGDQTRLIISTDNFFKINSTELDHGASYTLSWVAQLIEHCHCECVTITGHVDNVFNDRRRDRLSTEQAKAVAAQLWANGISDRRLVVSGESNHRQIATDKTVFGSGDNRRIEIRLY